jgi:hypothetical protein|tara:strand:+ start:1333 stop:1779 length:447 start_codon:yes stop_codon:yes gene_type:complete
MASTLTPTSFNVKIIEEQVVKNSVIKNEITYTITNVSNVDRRILTCPNTTSIDLFNLNGPNPGAGTFPSSSLQYARITNLDDTYNLALTISGSQGTITQEITPSSTLFIASSNITSSNFNGSFGDNIEYVKAYAISGSIDVEYTLVNS